MDWRSLQLLDLFCFLFGVMGLRLKMPCCPLRSLHSECGPRLWLCDFSCNCHTCRLLMHISCKICRQVLWGSKKPQNRSRELKCCQGRGQSLFPSSMYMGHFFYILWELKFSPRQTVQHSPCGVLPPEAVTEDKSAGSEGESSGSAIQCPWGMTNIFCWGGGGGQRLPESTFLW